MDNQDSKRSNQTDEQDEDSDELERMFSEENDTRESDTVIEDEEDGTQPENPGTGSPGDTRDEDQHSSEDTTSDDTDEFSNGVKEQSEVFRGYNVDNAEDIIEAINAVEPQAASEIRSIYNENRRLESKVRSLSEALEDVEEEFRQFRLQKQKQIAALEETAAKDFIKDILPVRDNLERSLSHDDMENVKDGIELIIEDFDESLQEEGVQIISPNRGDPVDPQVHKVMSKVKSDDVEEGYVVECHRPGYRIEDLLIRPARVTVSDG